MKICVCKHFNWSNFKLTAQRIGWNAIQNLTLILSIHIQKEALILQAIYGHCACIVAMYIYYLQQDDVLHSVCM